MARTEKYESDRNGMVHAALRFARRQDRRSTVQAIQRERWDTLPATDHEYRRTVARSLRAGY